MEQLPHTVGDIQRFISRQKIKSRFRDVYYNHDDILLLCFALWRLGNGNDY